MIVIPFTQELLRQKLLGGYSVVECEGEVGKSVVSACDDFTVETALEDLEFGFSITTSTQKVSQSHMHANFSWPYSIQQTLKHVYVHNTDTVYTCANWPQNAFMHLCKTCVHVCALY